MLLENQPYPQDTRVRNEAEALCRAGWPVTVLAPRAAAQRRSEVLRGVRVRRYRLPRERDGTLGFVLEYAVANVALLVLALGELARGARIVHAHNPPDTLFGVGLIARLVGGRFVYDHHDLWPELFAEKFGRSPLVRLLAALQRASFRAADLVITTNESQRRVALERGRVPAARVAVVRNGPLRATLVAEPGGRRGRLDDPHLVFLGTLETQDGVLDLPDVLRAVDQALGGHAARLTVIGDGTQRAELARRCDAAGIADRVRLLGRVAHERVPALLAEADVCIDPAPPSALNQQSTMIKIAEYLAAGRPVVAYDLVETRHTAGAAGRYAQPDAGSRGLGELIAAIAADGHERAALSRAAAQRAPELVWELSEATLVDAYARLR
jgi:glycosyltransferase involved in cell wall biosynthesis